MSINDLPTGLHTIEDRGELIDLLYQNNNSENLAVFFHGAVQGKKLPDLKLPIFSGSNIPLGAEVDRLMISDTTMAVHHDLRLGWFLGTRDYDFSARVDQILSKVCSIRSRRRIVLLGGSQGGFAALRASRKISGSIALVWNPQTRLKYFSWTRHLEGYMRYCFDVADYDALPKEVIELRHMDLTHYYRDTLAENFVFLMQNLEDNDHLQNHALPLFSAVGGKPETVQIGANAAGNQFILALGDWVGGHSLPDRATLEGLARMFFQSELATSELFRTMDFNAMAPTSFTNRAATDAGKVEAQQEKVRLSAVREAAFILLSATERTYLLSEFSRAPRGWFLQFGMSNLIEQAYHLGFTHVTAVDRNAERVEWFRRKLRSTLTDKGMQRLQLEHDETFEAYFDRPWLDLTSTSFLPDVVYVHGENAAEICAFLARRIRRNGSDIAPQVYLLDAANLVPDPVFTEIYTKTAEVGRVRKYSPGKT